MGYMAFGIIFFVGLVVVALAFWAFKVDEAMINRIFRLNTEEEVQPRKNVVYYTPVSMLKKAN